MTCVSKGLIVSLLMYATMSLKEYVRNIMLIASEWHLFSVRLGAVQMFCIKTIMTNTQSHTDE